jgi:two-component sensor histidine kinase
VPSPFGDAVAADSLRELFHRLNNQLGVILANAELIEARAADDLTRARAAQVVESAMQAMAAVRELRSRIEPDS